MSVIKKQFEQSPLNTNHFNLSKNLFLTPFWVIKNINKGKMGGLEINIYLKLRKKWMILDFDELIISSINSSSYI